VLFERGASPASASRALESLGAEVLELNPTIGVATVAATSADFVDAAMGKAEIAGVARDRWIGAAPRDAHRMPAPGMMPHRYSATSSAVPAGADPLYKHQWNMKMVDAGPSGSYSVEKGDRRVLVGVMDTGIEAWHPDLKRRVDRSLSKSFVRDIPQVDGPCRREKDESCEDPPLTDPVGHGTWVASAIAARYDGFGISGVAPGVKLVSLRALQDSGYIFLQPFVDGLTYAADNGIDVVNMSFFIDPWRLNCPSNQSDSENDQLEQATIIETVQRTVDYAREHNVTLVAALGNEWTDLAHPTTDEISPDYPPGAEYRRDVDNSCLELPAEAAGVVGVSALGPSKRKAWYSNYGMGETDVAAPGGDDFDPARDLPHNLPLGAISKEGLVEAGTLDDKGRPLDPFVLRRCPDTGRCAYYEFGAGTSYAAPIASGVAALIVSVSGIDDGDGGLTMSPAAVEEALFASSAERGCPQGGKQEYPEIGDYFEPYGYRWQDFTAICESDQSGLNGLYGNGIVNALSAVTSG
jgi:subtilisin family serine protease